MDCQEFQGRSMEWLYGELTDEDEKRLQEHLRDCSSCREDHLALTRSRDLLASSAVSGVAAAPPLDVASILQRAAACATRSRRRWRFVAAAAVTVALLLSLPQLLSIRIEASASRLSLSWGNDAGVAPAELAAQPRASDSLAAHERRLDELDRLIRVVVDEIDAGDRRLGELTDTVRIWIERVQRDDERKWRAMRRSIHSLHLADLSHRPTVSREGETQ